MKSVLFREETQEISYPCLMINAQRTIVLMTSQQHGVTVHHLEEDGTYLGDYSENWEMHKFRVMSDDAGVTLFN